MYKDIIIDGVNVAGCDKHNNFKFALYDCFENGGCQCKDNPNGYFKQHQRKEQECERLQAKIKELKKEREILNDEAVMVEITQGKWEQYQKAENDRDCYKQALKEINELAKIFENNYGTQYAEIDKILDIINEVLR